MANGEHGAARAGDPQTSHDAAESIKPSRLHGIIMETLFKAKTGLITHEIAHNCGIGYQTITPRMKAMVKKGWVYCTGEKREWMGAPGSPATGRKSMVYQLTALRPPEDQPVAPNKLPVVPEQLELLR